MAGGEGGQFRLCSSLGSETGIFRLKGKANLGELDDPVALHGEHEVDCGVDGLVEIGDDFHSAALSNLKEALIFQTLGGFPDDAAADAKPGGECSFRGQALLLMVIGKIDNPTADGFDQ